MDTFSNLIETVGSEFESIGLYIEGHNISAKPLNEEIAEALATGAISQESLLMDGLAEFQLGLTFKIGKVAWSDRVLYPDKVEEQAIFEDVTDDVEDELFIDSVKDALKAFKEQNKKD